MVKEAKGFNISKKNYTWSKDDYNYLFSGPRYFDIMGPGRGLGLIGFETFLAALMCNQDSQ